VTLTEAVDYLESKGVRGISLCQNTSALVQVAVLLRDQQLEIERLKAEVLAAYHRGRDSSGCGE
jgi:hypothetical protein